MNPPTADAPATARPSTTRSAHACFAATAFVCVGVFGRMLTYGSFRFVAEDVFRAIPAALAILTAVTVTHRYSAPFCPLLTAADPLGAAGFEMRSATQRCVTVASLTVLGGVSILITFAFTLHNQREIIWGVPDEVGQSYQQFRMRADDFYGVTHAR